MHNRSGDALLERVEPAAEGAAEGAATTVHSSRPSAVDALLAPPPALPTIDLAGVELHAVTQTQAIEFLLGELDSGRGGMLVTPNLDHLKRCVKDLSFAALVAEADLVVADGMPLVWAAKIQGTPLPERVAGSDLIWSLSEAAARRGRRVYLLGGMPGTSEQAGKILSEKYPNLRVVGHHCPAVGFERDEKQVAAIINSLAEAKPDIVFVALGSPKQERLISRIRNVLPNAWWLGVGISFSFICGDVKRAPAWMQRTGLEWLHRLWQEPRRLFKRYIIDGLPFAGKLMVSSAWRRAAGVPARTSSRRQVRRPGTGAGTPAVVEQVETQPRPIDAPTIIARPEGHSTAKSLGRLRAMILLGGSVRQNHLLASVKRSILDLPLEQGTTILNHWLGQAAELANYAGLDVLPARILVNAQSFEPVSGAARYAGAYTVERDASEYRGTGGVIRDLAQNYDDNDLVLIATASQVLLDPLSAIAAALEHKRGDVNLISHRDGTPSGVMLARVETLRLIPSIGFCDMKEQALSIIAGQYGVKVVHCRKPSALPVRSLADYIGALHAHHRRKSGKVLSVDPLAEDWQPSFRIIESGASVADGVHLHDSVVLRGAMIEHGASLVRSVVCPGAVVRSKQSVIDQFINP
ncbi:MAG TPA: WecB/TagA/CpsF family glycosyltransferase [Tepidisphaeraceae bacterium]|nr:WecB/TagA/CpsF family glycosyltransferase [Tepidisphaeraceae bacterium]